MKKIYIDLSAVLCAGAVNKGFVRNLYFIHKSLGYDVALTNEPNEIVKSMLVSEDIIYSVDAVIVAEPKDVLVSANEVSDFAGLFIKYAAGDTWDDVYAQVRKNNRRAEIIRTTKETDICVKLSLDGSGKCDISTGLGFFDHMLDQIGKHSGSDLIVKVNGDLEVDEHHTIEDTAIALGEAFAQAIGDKKGLSRYGFFLPMDECICWVAIDFGGRPWLNWVADFKREYVGDMPTEMFMHFFKSFSDAAKINLYIKAEGANEHHKIEGIFKGLAKAIKMAVKQEPYSFDLPSTKGLL